LRIYDSGQPGLVVGDNIRCMRKAIEIELLENHRSSFYFVAQCNNDVTVRFIDVEGSEGP
jgi:hypothetical protein